MYYTFELHTSFLRGYNATRLHQLVMFYGTLQLLNEIEIERGQSQRNYAIVMDDLIPVYYPQKTIQIQVLE